MSRYLRVLAPVVAVVLSVALAGPASASASIRILEADRYPGGKSVQLTITVSCRAPAEAQSFLSTTLWQPVRSSSPWYRDGQGQTPVTCDGTRQTYGQTATLTAAYADRRFRVGKAMTESMVTYCIFDSEGNGTCAAASELIRLRVHVSP